MIDSCQPDESLFASPPLDVNTRTRLRAYRRHALDCPPSGLSDRIVFIEKLREALDCRTRSFPHFSLLFVYIRAVTLCHDTHGSPTDSHIIDAIVAKLRRGLRAADLLIRSGEQGFVVFLSKASTAGAYTAATRLAAAIDNTKFFYESVAFQVKIDVTVAAVQAEDTVDTLLDRADRFLRQDSAGSLLQGHPLQPKGLGDELLNAEVAEVR
jgi:diguanylate cyclase (GGDEF)-like protein